jgi:type IV secretory pathway TrbD component
MVEGLGLRVKDVGFGIWSLGIWIQRLGSRVDALWFVVHG